jgi:predicted DNA-binding transcriptional regulator AlpA
MSPSPNDTVMEATEIASRLGWKRSSFLRKRVQLEAEGFPTMLPGRFGRWDRAAIDRWFRHHDEIKRLAAANLNQPLRIAFDRARLTELFAHGASA